jgi:hypothetical protein
LTREVVSDVDRDKVAVGAVVADVDVDVLPEQRKDVVEERAARMESRRGKQPPIRIREVPSQI